MKLYQLTLLLIYISISIIPIKNIIQNKVFEWDYEEELTPYSNWWCLINGTLLIIFFIFLICKLIEYLITKIDWNLILF